MSLSDLIRSQNQAPLWSNLRIKSLAIDNDLQVNGNIIGNIVPANVQPGANRTFLHTNELGEVVWTLFDANKVTGGNPGDILQNVGGVWSFVALPSNEVEISEFTVGALTALPDADIIPFDITNIASPTVSLQLSGAILFNEPGRYEIQYWQNALVDNSAIQNSLFIRKVSPLLNYARALTPKLQAGDTNNYSCCNVVSVVDVLVGQELVIYSQRENGVGNIEINNSNECKLIIKKLS